MKKTLIIAAVAALALTAAACAPKPKPAPGPTEPAAGCYDSSTSSLSLIYSGPLASYKNIQIATNSTGCGSDPTVEFMSLVLAPTEQAAIDECQVGADPAVDAVFNLNALGVDGMPAEAWMCSNPLSGALLQPGECFAVGTASVGYDGPRDTLDNVTLYSDTNDCDTAPGPNFTYVQHSSQAAAATVCASIDPVFDEATSISTVFPTIPDDAYVCTTA